MTGVALVTGAGGGLGRAIALVLDRLGLSVAAHYNSNAEGAKQLADALQNESILVQADCSDWESVRLMEERVRSELGPVTVLVNSGAVRIDGLMAAQAPAEWARVIEVNLIGVFHVCRAVLPRMLAQRDGRIVNIVSPAGLGGSEGQTAYSASKAGVIGMTRSLALECAKRRVTVNALSPGFMATALTEDVPEAARDRIVERIPLRRITTPEEVAEAVAFIVQTPYMTGQVVSVDGGLSA